MAKRIPRQYRRDAFRDRRKKNRQRRKNLRTLFAVYDYIWQREIS